MLFGQGGVAGGGEGRSRTCLGDVVEGQGVTRLMIEKATYQRDNRWKMKKKEEKETPIKVENNDAPVSTMTSPKIHMSCVGMAS